MKNADVPFESVQKVFEFGISRKKPEKYRNKLYKLCSLELYVAYYEVICQREMVDQIDSVPEAAESLIRSSSTESIESYFRLSDRIHNLRRQRI
jgi:hypothetical protein